MLWNPNGLILSHLEFADNNFDNVVLELQNDMTDNVVVSVAFGRDNTRLNISVRDV